MSFERIGIVTFEQICGRQNLGSTRLRAQGLIDHWPEAERFRIGCNYSTVIFQKVYWLEFALVFKDFKILDLCDPDLLNWNSPCIRMADACDAVTASTPQLTELISKYTSTPTYCIPDRIDFNSIGGRRKDHTGNGSTKVAAWFGYSTNFPSLDCAIPDLQRCGIGKLIVITDPGRPYWPPLEAYDRIHVINYRWSPETVYDQLLEADIVLNFRLDSGRWKYKSNNKTILAWSLGLPVAHNGAELSELMSEEARIREVKIRYEEVLRDYDVGQSVDEYKSLIDCLGIRPAPPSHSYRRYALDRTEIGQ
jgi:hypothetical protein